MSFNNDLANIYMENVQPIRSYKPYGTYRKIINEAAPVQAPAAPVQAPTAPTTPAAPAPAAPAAPVNLDVTLEKVGVERGATVYAVKINGFDVGGALEFNKTITFGNTNMQNVLSRQFQYPEVNNKCLTALNGQQFNDQAAFIAAAKTTAQPFFKTA